MLRHDRQGIQPLMAVAAVALVVIFALVAFATIATSDHQSLSPPGEDEDDALGYILVSSRVSYVPGYIDQTGSGTPLAGNYVLALGVGDYQGAAPEDLMFFKLPDRLTALGNDYAVTFDVTYPDGVELSDTELTTGDADSFDHTFVSDPFLVFAPGTYLVTAYFFVDGQQIGDGVNSSITLDGTNWTY